MGNRQCQAVQNEDSPVWRSMISSASTIALQQCVNQTQSSLVKHAIMNFFYVDDMAISMQYKSDVKCVIDDLKKVLLSRGFNLEKYMVNDADLMSGVPVCDRYMGR